MGRKSLSSNSSFDPDYIQELVNDIKTFCHVLQYLREAILSDSFKEVIHIRLDEFLCIVKNISNKHQNLNSVDLQNAAEMLPDKVKAVTLTEVNEENKTIYSEKCFLPLKLCDTKHTNLLQQTTAALQANKFAQPLPGRKNEMEKQRKEIKELWKQEHNQIPETETALQKAKLLCMQRQDEYEKAKSSMFRAEEKHQCSRGRLAKSLNKKLEKSVPIESSLGSSITWLEPGGSESDRFLSS
ncbi:Rho GTPase-activating protein 29 [Sciurus carolinensis]|uniref:Rho GTPase-activating protein 29 n=1 Tax=Sciurus carolinensis TaxID=30640 RepID=A0AA41MHW7_SCICA|nr:Rho GTPase-activating protein 29 [Sciurus carolinensis]